MWCDNFDGDLYKLVPAARDVLAPIAAIRLYTTCTPSVGGKINLPTCWHSDRGLSCYFGLTEEPPQPPHCWTDSPVMACTMEEAVRDLWAHCPLLMKLKLHGGHYVLWDSREVEPAFWSLLWDARGHRDLVRLDPEQAREQVLASLRKVVDRVKALGLGEQA